MPGLFIKRRAYFVASLFTALVSLCAAPMRAQSVVALPNTISTVAGGATTGGGLITGGVLPAKGAACSTGSPYTATDTFGDGCPGINTMFSSDIRGGLGVDGAGNVFVMDSSNSLLRKIDAKSGIVTAVTGTASCTAATSGTYGTSGVASDGYGDGCPFATAKLSTARGVYVDPYGNVLIAGYGMQTINLLCNAVSPLCPNTSGRKQVGYMYRVAGCVSSAAAAGTAGTYQTSGNGGDGTVATPFGNLSGDVSDWGSGSTGYGTCTQATVNNTVVPGEVSSPRGVAADKYGNVYIAETGASYTISGTGYTGGYRYRVVVGPATFTLPNGTTLTNPLASIIAANPAYYGLTAAAAYGKIYTILGGFVAQSANSTNGTAAVTIPTTIGASCYGGTAVTLDTVGDGCPFFQTSSGTGQQGVGIDAEGNVIFPDLSKSLVRVLYVGTSVAAGATTTDTMALAIRAANNNSTMAVTRGSVYPIIGAVNSGATNAALGSAPTLGTTTTLSTGLQRVALDAAGNIYITDFGQSYVIFFDIETGYARRLVVTGTVCSTKLDLAGDGCPANQSIFGGGGNGLGVGISPEGDMYLADEVNLLIRKVTATNLIALTKGTSVTQSELFHLPAGSTGLSTSLIGATSEISVGTPTCAAANADSTVDCTAAVTYTPVAPGQRSAVLFAQNGSGGSVSFPVAGAATASELVSDVASPVTANVGTVGSIAGMAVDGGGNLFLMDKTAAAFEEVAPSGTTANLGGTLPTTPYQLATDNMGNVYADGLAGSSITRLTQSGSAGVYSINSGPFVLPPTSAGGSVTTSTTTYGLAADRNGNLYVAEGTTQSVYEIPAATLLAANNSNNFGASTALIASGFSAVGELAFDGNGDLFIADTGASKVYRVLAGTTTATAFVSGVNPTHIAADAAGNLLVEDATAKTVTQYSLTGATTGVTVYTATATPTALAVNAAGAVYVAVTGATTLKQVQRNAETYTFPTSGSTLAATLSNSGNLNATGYAQTDSAEFAFTTGTTNGCGNVPSTTNALLAGAACTGSFKFSPGNNGQLVNSAVTLLAAASTTGGITLSGQEPSGTTYTTTTTVTGPSTAPYLPTGTEITFTVSEVASDASSQNGELVNVSIDGGTATGYTLSGGQFTVPISGLKAGSHTILATYPGDGTYLTSNNTASFTIAQATTTVNWTPTSTTQQYSVAIGTGVFNAYGTSASTMVPGSFVYTATPSGGAASTVDSASYLAIGSYTLAVTFTPTDATDYAVATKTLGTTYTVTKATTTAAVSASTMVVAASGGNYTSVNSAVTALSPTAGGSIYVAPGTYTEQVLVAYPNVSIHGLGGVAQNVVLTSETGAFAAANPTYGIAANPFGFNNDEASATLVVAKGTVGGTSYTPSNFYIDNMSIINTYDTDTNNTNAITGSNQTCTGQTTSSNNSLYNAGTLCASQALTVWITADKSVFNNVRLTSLQDTLAAYNTTGSNSCSGVACSSRQYYWKDYITGDIDYVFGDAAAVFDQTQFYTTYHNGSLSGNATIFAQNKSQQTGSTNDYLSAYIANNSVFTSQGAGTSAAMTALNFGRPYGKYATTVLLNNQVDDVVAAGWEEFSGQTNLPTSTYNEYGTVCTTSNCTTTGRETTSIQPEMIAASTAALYAPTTFLSTPSPDVWNPTTALATGVNSYVPSATSMSVNYGSSVTILAKPEVANGGGAIPTGSYTLMDGTNTLASGTLDASGATYFTTSTLSAGTHNITLVYGGDSNFSASTTASAFVLTVNAISTTTTVAVTTTSPKYGQSVTVTATVAASSGSTPTGNVQLSVDSGTAQSVAISGGVATFTLTGLSAGSHSLSAIYVANGGDATSTGTGSVSVAQAVLTVTATSTSRSYGTANPTLAYTIAGYQYSDGSSVVSGVPALSTTAVKNSLAGTYPISVGVGTLSATNYTFSTAAGTLTVNGGAAQTIVFAALPNLPNGTVTALVGRSTSGLALSYTVTGPASISGNTLTVSGTGTVTVTAAQSGSSTFAAATTVSRSFTAQ